MRLTFLICFWFFGWPALTAAQTQAQETAPFNVAAEWQRIGQERVFFETVFVQSEHVCYQRFAVTDCLHQARKSRRTALDELRHQELVLNDIDRRIQASAALKRIQEKTSGQ